MTFKANFVSGLEASRTLVVGVYPSSPLTVGAIGIRGTDTLGLSSWAGLATQRTFVVAYATVGSATLTATINTDTPDSTSLNVDSTDGLSNVPMLVFNLKSTVGASTVTDVSVTASGEAGALNKITAIELYDGNTLLGSVTPVSNVAAFTDLSIAIAKDATKVLTAKADFTTSITDGKKARLSIADPTTDITFDKPDLGSANAAGSAINGEYMYVFADKVAEFALSTPLSGAYDYNATTPTSSTASGVITFTVRANGGLLTELTSTDIVVDQCFGGSCSAISEKDVTVVPDKDIQDGAQATVTVSASKTRAADVGYTYFKIASITWTIDSGTPVAQTWGLTDYRTPSVNAH